MKKILIVDDEPNIVMALEYSPKKNNYEVYIARDGSEAIDLASKHEPDLVVLDIMMPKVVGYEVLEFIKMQAQLTHTKVLFLSAKNKEEDIKKGLEMGANDYMTKPFSMKKLIQNIQEQLA